MMKTSDQVQLTKKQVETLKQIEEKEKELRVQYEQLSVLKTNLLVFALESAGLSTDVSAINVTLNGDKLTVKYSEGAQIPNPTLEVVE